MATWSQIIELNSPKDVLRVGKQIFICNGTGFSCKSKTPRVFETDSSEYHRVRVKSFKCRDLENGGHRHACDGLCHTVCPYLARTVLNFTTVKLLQSEKHVVTPIKAARFMSCPNAAGCDFQKILTNSFTAGRRHVISDLARRHDCW